MILVLRMRSYNTRAVSSKRTIAAMNNIQLEHMQHGEKRASFPLCFLVHDLEGPENIGSVFRIADAMGVEEVILTGGSAVPPHRKIRKTSRSTEKTVPYVVEVDPLRVIGLLKAEGYVIISLEITSSSIDIRNLDIPVGAKVCLVLGSENVGVSQDLLDVSDHTVHIPMYGANSSMNVAMACAIASFTLVGLYSTFAEHA